HPPRVARGRGRHRRARRTVGTGRPRLTASEHTRRYRTHPAVRTARRVPLRQTGTVTMEPFITHTGVGVPLRRSNVDTDQIIPAVYLKRVARTGFDDALFAGWRKDPEFILNTSPYDQGSVLVAGPDFGTGSSREHAVWAL